jgi:hypothetical protein
MTTLARRLPTARCPHFPSVSKPRNRSVTSATRPAAPLRLRTAGKVTG